MRVLNFGGIPTSLGEIIHFKFYLDKVKSQYDQIRLGFATGLWDDCLHTNASDWQQKKILWDKYLFDIGELFFSEPPYILEKPLKWGGSTDVLVRELNIAPQKVEMGHLLCKGQSLNLGEEYIVITTKLRAVDPNIFYNLSDQLWDVLQQLSKKYKIVILGEQKVEIRKEYENNYNAGFEPLPFGIYDNIIDKISNDRLEDKSVPALGETVSNLSKIQQDCLIMKEAKFVITLGIGGNFCLATSVSNMVIGYRGDNNEFADAIFHNKEYHNAIITKDWNRFIDILRAYMTNQSPPIKNIKAYLPFRGEFGWYIMLYIKKFHIDPHPNKLVCCKRGHECLFPTATQFYYDWSDVPDNMKAGVYEVSDEDILKEKLSQLYPDITEYVSLSECGWHNKHDYAQYFFAPKSISKLDLKVDVVVCPRYRQIDASRNLTQIFWQNIVDQLVTHGFTVGVCGNKETTLELQNVKYCSYDFIDVDSDIQMINNSKLVIGQESGMQYLTFLCQRPYICIGHYHKDHGADLYREPNVFFCNVTDVDSSKILEMALNFLLYGS